MPHAKVWPINFANLYLETVDAFGRIVNAAVQGLSEELEKVRFLATLNV